MLHPPPFSTLFPYTTLFRSVYIHGSRNNYLLNSLEDDSPACLTVTLVDSIVAGRSGFGCSMDYRDRKSIRLNSSHGYISYAVFCLKKKNITTLQSISSFCQR